MSLALAFIMLFAGGMLLGGTWSFFRTKKPWWQTALLGVVGAVCIGVSLWRILA
ncbi:hypothetical protein [Brachybacterium hainanense]|uniref:Amidotransferase n=1 Tax=Brachybacterium hainanense TaxID=1541174 RepID=A0ABV6R8L0_9MICO